MTERGCPGECLEAVAHALGVDGRLDIVALYQIHIVGVRVRLPRFHRGLSPL